MTFFFNIALRLINMMEKNDRIAMLYAMLATADEQVKVYTDRVLELQEQCMKLQERIYELESQIYGGKVK